ncbi:MAG: EboA family metabolite traffic protein [Desmonostoc vinosum HA7617-LM4]|jgi:hypothetical protein|nr:EboA family metabolite traffic protein [Desmonostoc vinosum HA7617-LM4]
MSSVIDFKPTNIVNLLYEWVAQQVTQETCNWLDEKRQEISSGVSVQIFFTAFSAVPRYTGKNRLELTPEDLQAASTMQTGWFPIHWHVEQAARTLLVLALPQDDADKYVYTLERVFTAADVGELVALYQALPLLSHPEKLQKLAAEGVRSNMTVVFNAIALRNSYPAQYFDTLAWNQMVLKALFVGSPLDLIQGIRERANPELARMLIDYARERYSAHRCVPNEIWPLVSQFMDDLSTQRQGSALRSECGLGEPPPWAGFPT